MDEITLNIKRYGGPHAGWSIILDPAGAGRILPTYPDLGQLKAGLYTLLFVYCEPELKDMDAIDKAVNKAANTMCGNDFDITIRKDW